MTSKIIPAVKIEGNLVSPQFFPEVPDSASSSFLMPVPELLLDEFEDEADDAVSLGIYALLEPFESTVCPESIDSDTDSFLPPLCDDEDEDDIGNFLLDALGLC
jgi:hypothetical protein